MKNAPSYALVAAILTLSISLSLSIATTSQASGPIGLFSLQSNSARSNALGGISVTLVDAESPLHNPGSLGLFGLTHRSSASLPDKTNWLTSFVSDETLESYSGHYTIWNKKKQTQGRNYFDDKLLSLSIGVSHLALNHGSVERRTSDGIPIGRENPRESITKLSVGLGIDKTIRIGVGLSANYFDFSVAKQGFPLEIVKGVGRQASLDFGITAEAPMSKPLSQDSLYGWALKFIPTIAFTHALISPNVTLIDKNNPDELPKFRQFGSALYIGLTKHNLTFISSQFFYQTGRVNAQHRQAGFAVDRRGVEIGIVEALFLRVGKLDDKLSDQSVTTSGIGFSLAGLIKITKILTGTTQTSNQHDSNTNKFDLRIDFSEYTKNSSHAFAGTKFFKVTASF